MNASSATDADQLAISAIRALSIDAVERADSGHPGAPMGLAPLAYVLFTRHLKHNPANPGWIDRDRFVLSAGHASMLLYSLLHLTGYELSIEDLKDFRQLESRTPGHPESFATPGVETTTGPLGQGVANAVGFALAEKLVAARFNQPDEDPVIDHRTWVIASDGDLMEGVASEACSIAGQLALDNLVVIWDDNSVTLDGPANWSFDVEDVVKRFDAYGWRTLEIADGNDVAEIDRVLGEAAQSDGRPTFVRLVTTIGFGAPTKAGTNKAHGSPLGAEEAAAAKEAYGWTHEPFVVPDEVYEAADQRERGAAAESAWDERYQAFESTHPDLAEELERAMAGELAEDWDEGLPEFEDGHTEATRQSSGAVIQRLAAAVPELIGGSADLAGSNKTTIENSAAVTRELFAARNINFGVREHAMAGMANGMLLHGGLRPFVGTFLTFSDYMRGSIRLAALSGLGVIFVFTHDSIGLGEDGPTHQSVEHLAALRAIPNLRVIRPADARETVGAWIEAIQRTDGPTALALSRQGVPVLPGSDASQVALGGYALNAVDDPDLVLVGTGSEVQHCVEAARILAEEDDLAVRVVSLPCMEALSDGDEDYADELLGAGDVPVLSVEAGVSFGWERWADDHVAMDDFGASAPGEVLMEEFGFTGQAVAEAARELLDDWEDED
ncbi:transketolase [Euzebya sp.]|uniref:transketolase n=1 Tax=Euzebya sp. TaxID=1971409 RepID=UPI003518A537